MTDPITRLNAALEGRYRIERELGQGGMATVYLADDLRHERKVALKVLKPELAAVVGAERFLAEIKTTANLQHPHILPLFDSGEADSFLFYVMPYVEGETLRDKLDREHQLPVAEAVKIATNVAEALEYAHSQGVIHRDIKPANILLQAGKPVLSDFGIALAVGVAGGGRLTETGLSLGTPHYMSPEQATGDLSVGAATDIYALGCVLYEMLVGDPPYVGSTAQAILGKIVTGDADPVTQHRKSVPLNVEAAIHRALEKVPADRFMRAQELVAALGDPGFRHRTLAIPDVAAGPGPWNRLSVAMTGVAALAIAVAGASMLNAPEQTAPEATRRFAVDLPEGLVLRPGTVQPINISPDGETVIVTTTPAGQGQSNSQLFRRTMGSLDMLPIRGTEGAASFAVSPDGGWVAFNSVGALEKIQTSGGPPVVIAETPGSGSYRGVSWGDAGTIVYASGEYDGLLQVADVGGAPEPLTVPVESGEVHLHPHVVPGGETVLFVVRRAGEPDRIAAASTESGAYETLTTGDWPQLGAEDLVVFQRGASLWAAEWDPARRTLGGDPVPVLEGVRSEGSSRNAGRFFLLATDGTLVYREGSESGGASGRRLVIVDLDGNEEVLVLSPRDIESVGWFPDGRSVVYSSEGQIYTYDVELRTTPRQLTFEGANFQAVISPDGTQVAFTSNRAGTAARDLFVKSLVEDAPERLLIALDGDQYPVQWVSDSVISFESEDGLWTLDLSDPDNPRPESYLTSEASLRDMVVSPDRTLAAYASDESGQNEVYLRSFPNPGGLTIVSQDAGLAPSWSPDGSMLYYPSGLGRPWMAARIQRVPVPTVLSTDTLFTLDGGIARPLAGSTLHPDGDRFVVALENLAASADGAATEPQERLILVQNWMAEVRARMGTR